MPSSTSVKSDVQSKLLERLYNCLLKILPESDQISCQEETKRPEPEQETAQEKQAVEKLARELKRDLDNFRKWNEPALLKQGIIETLKKSPRSNAFLVQLHDACIMVFRTFFRLFDLGWVLGQPTMAETYNPLAKKMLNKDHFFQYAKPTPVDELSKEFENALQTLDSLILNKNLAEKLKRIAHKFQELAITRLHQNRADKGFQHFIADLKDEQFNCSGSDGKWSLCRGLLTVELPCSEKNASIIQDELNTRMKDFKWFEQDDTRNHEETSATPHRRRVRREMYNVPIKTLGKFGANPAVDPIMFVMQADGTVQVLAIRRDDGALALPGGMLEGKVLDTWINELLEEVFSGSLFAENSTTFREVDTRACDSEMEPDTIIRNLVLKEINKFGQLQDSQLQTFQASFPQPWQQSTGQVSISDYIQRILAYLAEHNLHGNTTSTTQLITHIKCELYRVFFAEKYLRFADMVRENAVTGDSVINASDPRNTDRAWMETTPLRLVIDECLFKKFAEQCGLYLAAGDDAFDAHIIPLETFCLASNPAPYSDHVRLVVDALANEIETGRISPTPALLNQIEAIRKGLEQLSPPVDPEKEEAAYQQSRGRVSL